MPQDPLAQALLLLMVGGIITFLGTVLFDWVKGQRNGNVAQKCPYNGAYAKQHLEALNAIVTESKITNVKLDSMAGDVKEVGVAIQMHNDNSVRLIAESVEKINRNTWEAAKE